MPLLIIVNGNSFKKKAWDKMVNSTNADLVDKTAFDLLTKMLTIDHSQRISSQEALTHPYFKPIKENPSLYRKI